MNRTLNVASLDVKALQGRIREVLDFEIIRLRVLLGGTENRHVLVETQAGAYVLSMLEKRDAVAAERYANYVAFLFEHGMPLPRIHRFASGRLTTTIQGVPAVLCTLICGTVLRPFPIERTMEIGTILAKLHTLRFEQSPEPHIRLSEADLQEVQVRWLRDWLHRSYAASQQVTSAHYPRVACHCDLFPDNIILSSSGNLVVIDWEDGGEELPVIDIAMAILGLCCPRGFAPQAANALLQAYMRAGGHWIDLADLRHAVIYCSAFIGLARYLRRDQHRHGKTRVQPYQQMPLLLEDILRRWGEVHLI